MLAVLLPASYRAAEAALELLGICFGTYSEAITRTHGARSCTEQLVLTYYDHEREATNASHPKPL